MDRIIINADTGEIIDRINLGDRIVRKKSIDAMLSFESIPKEETFTKLYQSVIPHLVECELTAAELILFLHLAVNLRYQSNVAKYRNGKLITRANLAADLKMCDKTVRRCIYRLIKNGLIVEANTIDGKVFIVNPYLVMVGDKVNKTVFDLFRKSKWARW
jgi:hypothetical protein